MKKDNIEFFDIVNEKDEVVGKISENRQNTIKPSQLRFINIIITNNDRKIVVPKRSSNRRIFPNCYDFSVGGHVTNYDQDGIEKLYYMTKEEVKKLMNNKPNLRGAL